MKFSITGNRKHECSCRNSDVKYSPHTIYKPLTERIKKPNANLNQWQFRKKTKVNDKSLYVLQIFLGEMTLKTQATKEKVRDAGA